MGIVADRTYDGVVTEGKWTQSQNLRNGFQINLRVEDDPQTTSFYVIWLTAKNKDRIERDFKVLGVSIEQIRDPEFLMKRLPEVVRGVKLSFNTKAEEFQGKVTTKVAGINRRGAADVQSAVSEMLALFGEVETGGNESEGGDDIPFAFWLAIPFLLPLLHYATSLMA